MKKERRVDGSLLRKDKKDREVNSENQLATEM